MDKEIIRRALKLLSMLLEKSIKFLKDRDLFDNFISSLEDIEEGALLLDNTIKFLKERGLFDNFISSLEDNEKKMLTLILPLNIDTLEPRFRNLINHITQEREGEKFSLKED